MATAALGKELECSICLNLYTDPVTLRCGHNFCRGCIDQVLNTQDGSGVYSCPECREEFKERPMLQKNITLCNVVENFLSAHREGTKIHCTYCIHSPVPAVKSCLMCEASLCDDHLRVHSKSPEHVLTDPSTSLEKRKCSVHKKVLEYYCSEDNACICVSCCLIGEHKGHNLESLEIASEKKKEKFYKMHQKLIKKRGKTEEKVHSVEERRRKAQENASENAKRVTALFIDIRRYADDLEKRVLSEISRKEEQLSLSLSDVIQKLEIKKEELSRKMRHIEELCNMEDPLTVLQDPDTGDLCDPEEGGDDEGDTGGHDGGDEDTGDLCDPEEEGGDEDTREHHGSEEDTGSNGGGNDDTGGHDGGDQGLELISHTLHTLSKIIRDVNVTTYIQDPADILLDVSTAGNYLLISNDQKIASWTHINQNHPESAERFQDYQVMSSGGSPYRQVMGGRRVWCGPPRRSRRLPYSQVMSSRGFSSGRHYWDVEISGSELWRVGMCYPSIDRRGDQSRIGNSMKSWCLGKMRGSNHYKVIHDNNEILLPHQISSNRVRIYLDYEAGQLSFYELCDPIRHLHTFTTTFTEPLHAALCVFSGCIKISGRSSSCEETSPPQEICTEDITGSTT